MNEHEERLAAMRAESDQARAALREFAETLFTFYQGCRDAGFSRREALALTRVQQDALMRLSSSGGGT